MTEQAVYVYAVARPFDAGALEPLRGVDGTPVGLVGRGDLVAVASHVPLHRFDEAALKANLEDLRWLEGVARAHHAVVDAVARHTAALPLRLATVYHSDERVDTMLEQQRAAFGAALDRITGRLEWGVKVYADVDSSPASGTTAAAAADDPADDPADASAVSPGRAYLRRRQTQRQARDRSWEQAAEVGRQVDAALAPLAEDVRRHRAQDPKLSGQPGENVLNAAYLVRKEDSDAFVAHVHELLGDRPGVRVELTGPWAPYSFAPAGEPADAQHTTEPDVLESDPAGQGRP